MTTGQTYGLRPAQFSHSIASVCVMTCALMCLPGCAKVAFQSQRVDLLLDEATDTLTLELTYHGLMAAKRQGVKWADGRLETNSGEPDLESGKKLLLEIARGEPVFMLLSPILEIRLNQASEEPEESAGATSSRDEFEGDDFEDSGLEDRAAKYLAQVQVQEARVFVDDNERLTAYQRLSFPQIGTGLALWNESIRRDLLASYEAGKIKPSEKGLDEATLAIVLADIRSEHDWVSCADGELQLSIPASAEFLARLLTQSLTELGEPKTEGDSKLTTGFAFLAELFSPLSSLTMQDDHIQLSFALDRPGGVRLNVPFSEFEPNSQDELAAYDPALLDFMRRDDSKLPLAWLRNE